MKKKILVISALALISVGSLGTLTACTEADKVSNNIANDADNFQVRRRVVVINTRTDKVEMEAEGLISVDIDKKRLDIIAKVGKNEYKKDIVNLTQNNMYSITQVEGTDTNPYKYQFTWLPQSVVPIEIKGEEKVDK